MPLRADVVVITIKELTVFNPIIYLKPRYNPKYKTIYLSSLDKNGTTI